MRLKPEEHNVTREVCHVKRMTVPSYKYGASLAGRLESAPDDDQNRPCVPVEST